MEGEHGKQNLTSQTHSDAKKTVFLFKSPKDNERDKYNEVLGKSSFLCVNIPVLSFRFVNQELLRSKLCAINLFSAIIFTSIRAVEAVSNLLHDIQDFIDVSKVESFAIGPTTFEAARKAGFNPKGEMAGNADALGHLILQEDNHQDEKPFLYPCSDLHQDVLKDVLLKGGKLLTEVIAYETCPHERLKESLTEALEHQGFPDFTVFFSPSGFQYTLAVTENSWFSLNKTHIVALGPSTKKSILSQGYSLFSTADKPDPQGLLNALTRGDRSLQKGLGMSTKN